ncbi:MAG: glycosyltransferase [Planctomycetes bacterium]|nr:glycosyltransferase [Planctomycetota bacterium]
MTTDSVTLVVPGRNCARTIRLCLASATALTDTVPGSLREIIFVDDGSNDETAEIVAEFAVTCLSGDGRGPGSARNIGWRAAKHPLIWFMDSDCVAEPEVLARLLPHMKDPNVGGVSGSYSNLHAKSLLACLVHEEIVERHGRMPRSVNFLATFNVIYRRSVLEQVDGFDERYLKAQDAELSFRVMEAGYELRFEREALVGHHHETRWRSYLQTQRQQGYWRAWLHMSHAGHAAGDSYSRLSDHIQPPLALLAIALTPLLWVQSVSWVPIGTVSLLAAAQVPMAYRLVRRTGRLRYLFHAWMSFVRAFYRGVGLAQGLAGYVASKLRRSN